MRVIWSSYMTRDQLNRGMSYVSIPWPRRSIEGWEFTGVIPVDCRSTLADRFRISHGPKAGNGKRLYRIELIAE